MFSQLMQQTITQMFSNKDGVDPYESLSMTNRLLRRIGPTKPSLVEKKICQICYQELSYKRTTTLGHHKLHRTCLIKLAECVQNTWRREHGSSDFACSASRANQERRHLITVLGQLTQDKRCAIRERKNDYYVEDIEEEMVIMRKRMQDVDNFLLAEALQATERVEEEDSEEDESDGLGDDPGGVGHDNGWETEEEDEDEDQEEEEEEQDDGEVYVL
ncbi:hypothetical protein PRIPAC_91615 [Pristionchus pacificus]|uniref:Uncharacterized protein n=1 Tax=Pristionchus pacificus TaxID=54126 RepID=A0A2A6CDR2_PRIPA|nr:hypothetical protein PRIPAC_91615 [Pristionchus pacificus]|eukprot:PDM76183.1 hypothetical protein PRIPAC_39787 [Pristionchus pacificus]